MVDEEIFGDKLRHINRYTDDLKQIRGMSKREYTEDMVTQRAVERTLMNLSQACIDIARHVRSAEDLPPGGTAKEEMRSLGDAGILSGETRAKMEEAVGPGISSLTGTATSTTRSCTTSCTTTSADSSGSSRNSPSGFDEGRNQFVKPIRSAPTPVVASTRSHWSCPP